MLVASADPAFGESRVLLLDRGGEGWVQGRLLRMVGAHLESWGVWVIEPGAASSFGRRALPGRALAIEVVPADLDRAEAEMSATVRLAGQVVGRLKGRAAPLDTTALTLARAAYRHLHGRGPPDATGPELPFSVHRLLGRAEARLRDGQLRQARIMLERALDRAPRIVVPSLIEARRLRLDLDAEAPVLVQSALERAEDAARRGAAEEAFDGYLDAVRFGALPRRRWQRDLPSGPRRTWMDGKSLWSAQGRSWLRMDGKSGAIIDRGKSAAAVLFSLKEDLLTLDRAVGVVRREARTGPDRWRARSRPGHRTELSPSGAGQLALIEARRVRWLDSTLGRTSARARGHSSLAVGEAGALMQETRGLSLVRPGRTRPTWTASIAESSCRQAVLTGAKAVLRTDDALWILDAHDGAAKTVRGLSTASRLLGARGRHAVIATGSDLRFVDILAGVTTAKVRGPSRAIGAYSGPFALSILFATGDLIHWDPDGLLLDRARVRGRPLRILAGPPEAPGPVVETELGLIAFADVRADRATDLDHLLEAARWAWRAGRKDDARALAAYVARISAGRVADAESLRVAWMAPGPARGEAKRRANAARDPLKALPPFRMLTEEWAPRP